MKKLFIFSALCMSILGGIMTTIMSPSASAVSGNDYNAGNLISDEVMRDYNSMSESDIQNFLKSKNSCNDTRTYIASWYPQVYYHIENGHFVCMADETFNGQSAAHIIYRAAQDFHINPKVLIVMLQKEQGLVTDTFPHNLQYRSATGYGCPDASACDTKYYGFENQVRNTAALFDDVMNGGWTNYPVGWRFIYYYPNASCGGSNVYIENRATSALYRYTPYQPNQAAKNAGYGTGDSCSTYGNRNFFLYFNDWFGSTQVSSSTPTSTGWEPMAIPRKMIARRNTDKIIIGSNQRRDFVYTGRIINFLQKTYVTHDGIVEMCLRSEADVINNNDSCFLWSDLEEMGPEPEPIEPVYRRVNSNTKKVVPTSGTIFQNLSKDTVTKFVSKITINHKTYYRTEYDTNNYLYIGTYASTLSDDIFINFLYPRSMKARRKTEYKDVFTEESCNHTLKRYNTDYFTTKIFYKGKWFYRSDSDSRAGNNCVIDPDDLAELK